MIVVDRGPVADLGGLCDVAHVVQGGEVRAPGEIGLRTDDDTEERNTAELVAGRPGWKERL